jgi:hypothetical protein
MSFVRAAATKLRSVNPEMMAAFGRTLAQTLAGIIGAMGLADDDMALAIGSGIVWTAITWWGIWARKDSNLLASAANVPIVNKVVVDDPVVASNIPTPKVVSQTF